MGKTMLLMTLLLLVCAGSTQAQSYYHREHGLYLEVFGTGGELSANYKKLIDNRFAVRVGGGLTGVAYRKGFAVPFSVNTLLGAEQNYLEFGIGGTYLNIDDNSTDDTYLNILENQVVGNAILGYRYLGDYGFTFRLAFTPAWTTDGFEPMGGAMKGKTW